MVVLAGDVMVVDVIVVKLAVIVKDVAALLMGLPFLVMEGAVLVMR